MGIQSPARKVYSPNFIAAIETVKKDPGTNDTFAHFEEPWFFRDTPEEYSAIFENAGFEVTSSRIDKVVTPYTTTEAIGIFDSGAAAGYLNQDYYDIPITHEYVESFKHIVRDSFSSQSDSEGKLSLVFFRIYLTARKP